MPRGITQKEQVFESRMLILRIIGGLLVMGLGFLCIYIMDGTVLAWFAGLAVIMLGTFMESRLLELFRRMADPACGRKNVIWLMMIYVALIVAICFIIGAAIVFFTGGVDQVPVAIALGASGWAALTVALGIKFHLHYVSPE